MILASPHVTGLVAYLIALESLSGVAQVKARLNELAGKDMISGLKGGSPNRLAYNGVGNVDKAGVYICNAPGESFETAVPEEPVETGKDDVPDDDVATGPVFSVSAD